MASRMLSIIRANAAFDVSGTLPLVVAGDARLGRVLVFCRNLRRRGICSLFLEGLPLSLHADLQRSGAAYLHVLRSATEEEKITSRAGPFFDSVACQDLNTAREIARYSRLSWNQEEEYEDDFLYILFLMKKFLLGADDTELGSIAQRYAELAAETGDPRSDICSSFLESGNLRFDSAFSELIRSYGDHYETGIDRDEILEEEWGTEGSFFVEGLALIRFAQIQGFQTEANYRFIPSLAIDTRSGTLSLDSWRNP